MARRSRENHLGDNYCSVGSGMIERSGQRKAMMVILYRRVGGVERWGQRKAMIMILYQRVMED